jgi:K+-transporting ATPase ATPase C chain
MWREAFDQIKTGLILLVLFTILTGLIYPAVITVFAQLFFPKQANGSFIEQNGKTIGSLLIGQSFTAENYFWGRPSATSPYPYNAESSSGSNMGPSNLNFLATVKERVNQFHTTDSHNNQLIPVDLVTASGSGLDPEISPLAAFYQVPRIAKAHHISEEKIQALIQNSIQNRTLGILGEPRVNILQLNIALDNEEQ